MDFLPMSLFVSLFVFSFSTSITPGPNNMMLLSSGLTHGYRKSLPHLLGVIIGFPFMTLCVGLVVGELFKLYPAALSVLKVIGFIYLIYLAWKISKSKPKVSTSNNNVQPLNFYEVFLFQWLNVKNWIKIITATSVYVTSASHPLVQILTIVVVFLSTVIISANTWTLAGSLLSVFLKSEKSVRIFNITMAILLVLSMMPVVIK